MSLKSELGLPLPNKPDTKKAEEMRRWVDAMYDWLDRFRRKFTGQWIKNTIINELGNTGLLPEIPDPEKDYILAYDHTDHSVKWIETTTTCPP